MNKQQEEAIAAIDDEELVRLLVDLVDTPSSTGSEEKAARVLADFFLGSPIEPDLQIFAPNRANMIARLPGSGGGPTLMLNGHLDTSYTGEEPELQGDGYKNKAVIVDDEWIYGNGVHNMKSAVASFAEVLMAISRSGIRLAGDVLLAGVAGEIERAPYGRFQGPEYDGFGAGTAYALDNGLDADVCILGEPTTNTIGLSNLGITWIRLGVKGTMAHTQHASEAINAITRARRLMDALDTWIIDYRKEHEFEGLKPAADITAIEGGLPYRVSRIPVFCDTFLCVRIPPSTTPQAVVSQLEERVGSLGPEVGPVEVEVYVSHPGSVIAKDESVAAAVHRAHTAITGAEPEYRPRGAYMDSSHLVASGIPTVVYGPSGRVRTNQPDAGWAPSLGEHTNLADLRQYTRVVVAAAVDLCSQ